SLMALTVADKVRNPATVIGGLCRRIFEKEKVSGRLGGDLNNIIEETHKLEEIVNDFQTLLKSRQSMFKLDDINKTVKSVVSIIKKEAASRAIKMTADISEEPLNINMQKHLLRIALFHIMRNSIEATPEGGSITVKTFTDGDIAVIKVSDTGNGISQEDIERIFDPFFSTKKSGFGMGLPLVKQILHEHLGELSVESKPGKGTVFNITFPIRWKEDTLIG
ncbi:MAG: HAMP domain-containing sensor histidine kinase, partial [Thermodesulfovibrionales bacterium]